MNNNINIDIFGSCVTRDSFDFGGGKPISQMPAENLKGGGMINFSVNKYNARCSLVSLYSAKTPLKSESIPKPEAWGARNTLQDFNKTFFREIEGMESPYIIVDFIDEVRLNVAQLPRRWNWIRPHYVTVSDVPPEEGGYVVEGRELSFEEKKELFPQSARKFAKDLICHYPAANIVIHKAYYSYSSDDGSQFDASTIKRFNDQLTYYYEKLHSELPDSPCINIEKPVAAIGHRWGQAPFHYTQDYYDDFIIQLRGIVGGKNECDG
ncbi:MAG: DUF6270 domain-containing protein [Clostridiales Family XIII bacterium]|jgi:hypothetical protein|nr:DUF6270 domain-containing protein [Clostridiales Family XIII bacterium]